MENYTKSEIFEMVEDEDVQFIRLQFTDIMGNLKNIAVPSRRLFKIMENRCSIDMASVIGFVHGEEADLYLRPNLGTFTILPWRPQQGKVARFLCDICRADGTEYEGNPRLILQKVIDRAHAMGYSFYVNPECEFFLFHTDDNGRPTTVTHEQAGYLDTSPIDLGENTRRDIILTLEEMGYEIDSSHHEGAPAQHEIDFTFEPVMETADKIMTFKTAVRTIAKRYGLHATFMPKPKEGVSGSGMHINMKLLKDGRNVFEGTDGELSAEGRAFMAGIMAHIQGMTAICNPLVNSYKRLVPGFEAPSEITWSRKRRNALFHVKKDGLDGTILELRSPDSAANPYLVLALCLAAGLDGIEKNLEVPAELKENVEQMSEEEKMEKGIESLPENLGEALAAMKADPWIRETVGNTFMKAYTRTKRKEWKGYLNQVSEWEINQYLYLI